MFGVARQKLDIIIHKKRNWMQEQLVVISLVIQKSRKGLDFIALTILQGLQNLGMLVSLRMM